MHDHDAIGEGPIGEAASDRGPRRRSAGGLVGSGAPVVLGAAYAWWAVARPPFSPSATVAVLLAGVAAAVAGARARRRGWPHVEVRTTVPWAVLVVVAGLWQLAAYVQHPRADHPTLSSLANGMLDSRPARAAAFSAWVLAMVGLARR